MSSQQHTNNLRRNNHDNVADMMCKLVNQQSAPEIDMDEFSDCWKLIGVSLFYGRI